MARKKDEEAALEQELPVRDQEVAAAIRRESTAKQIEFYDDEARRRSLIAGRRAGKTYGGAAGDLVQDALLHPDSVYLYVALSKETARNILWDNPATGLKRFDRQFNLQLGFNNQSCIATFKNGSQIYLHGAKNEDALEKLRGRPFRKAKVDECASFAPKRIQRLVDKVLGPAMADYRGQLDLMGTPGKALAGTWFESTSLATFGASPLRGQPKCAYHDAPAEQRALAEWSLHRWSVADNTALPHIWAEEAQDEKRRKGWADDNPDWVNEWLGLWIIDLESLVYRYDQKFDWDGGPLPAGHVWEKVGAFYLTNDGQLGVVVCAYSATHPHMYQVDDKRAGRATADTIARILGDLDRKHNLRDFVGARQSGGKALLEELRMYYSLDCHPFLLRDKHDLVVLANADLEAGRIHVLGGSELAAELQGLQWSDPGEREDTAVTTNVLSTAFLGAWRFSFHRNAREPPQDGPKHGTPEFRDKLAAESLKRLEDRERALQSEDWLEREIGQPNVWEEDPTETY